MKNALKDDYGDSIDLKYCFSFDVQSGQLSSCPKSFKRRMGTLRDTALEISERWDAI
jgi:hypothetical protein